MRLSGRRCHPCLPWNHRLTTAVGVRRSILEATWSYHFKLSIEGSFLTLLYIYIYVCVWHIYIQYIYTYIDTTVYTWGPTCFRTILSLWPADQAAVWNHRAEVPWCPWGPWLHRSLWAKLDPAKQGDVNPKETAELAWWNMLLIGIIIFEVRRWLKFNILKLPTSQVRYSDKISRILRGNSIFNS